MKRIYVFSLLVLALVIMPILASAAELRLGILPRLSEKEMVEMFTPLARYLEKETGYKVTLIVPKDFDSFTKMAINGDFHIGYANPNIYIDVKKAVKETQPLGMASEKETGTNLTGVLFTLKESPISNVQAIKGKKVGFVDKGSAAGYVAQMLTLKKAGIAKEDIKIVFEGKPPLVAEAVKSKKVDAGGMPESVYNKLPFVHMLKVIAKTDNLPNWPIFSTKTSDAQMTSKVKDAILKLKPSIKTVPILGIAKLEGFVSTSDKDFELMRDAARAAGVF